MMPTTKGHTWRWQVLSETKYIIKVAKYKLKEGETEAEMLAEIQAGIREPYIEEVNEVWHGL